MKTPGMDKQLFLSGRYQTDEIVDKKKLYSNNVPRLIAVLVGTLNSAIYLSMEVMATDSAIRPCAGKASRHLD